MKNNDLISNYIDKQMLDVPIDLNNVIESDGVKLNYRPEFYKITQYINKFLEGKKLNRFIVLPGIRGVGKTTLLYQIYDYLISEQKINMDHVLFISCEELNKITDFSITEVVDIFLKNYHDTKVRLLKDTIFLLVDESQYTSNWALDGKILYDKSKQIFMIFTGSSALNLEYNADAARRMLKENIPSLNYTNHLKLKYDLDLNDMSSSLHSLIFEGKVDDAIKAEKNANRLLINYKKYNSNDWNEYFKYGGFTSYFEEENPRASLKKIEDMVDKVIYMDMSNLKNFTYANQSNANRILLFLSLQRSSEVSQNYLIT